MDRNKLKRPAFQIGLNWIHELARYRLEYNQVGATVYEANRNGTSYMHYNQSLAHPAGNNFREVIGQVMYRKKRMFALLKGNYLDYQNSSSVVVQDTVAYQANSDVIIQEIAVGWLVNPANGMNVRIGLINRDNLINRFDDSVMLYFGFRTALPLTYYDF